MMKHTRRQQNTTYDVHCQRLSVERRPLYSLLSCRLPLALLRIALCRAVPRRVAPVCLPCFALLLCVCNNSQSVALSRSHTLSHVNLTLGSLCQALPLLLLSQHRTHCCCVSDRCFVRGALALSQCCALFDCRCLIDSLTRVCMA